MSLYRVGLLLITVVTVSARILSSTSIVTDSKNEENVQSPQLRGFPTTADLSIDFPSMTETLEMAKLSSLVYQFKDQNETYCTTFSNDDGIRCHWYFHDEQQGTKVMIVTNSHKRYIAIVFAGTDDLRTSLQDMHIAKKPFGDNDTIKLDNPDIKVHAGFDNAVFSGVFQQVSDRLKQLQFMYPLYTKVYTTGHSLGAANSILTATALAYQGQSVVSINFGCPRTGNKEWKEFLNTSSPLNAKLGIWKVVLGWDLVPRLPEFFDHVGHTIQLWSQDHYKYNEGDPDLVECYYRHYGDADLGYAGIPAGWNGKPYAWMPGAIYYHFIGKYIQYLEILSQKKLWVNEFKKIEPINYDDDKYIEPPDDWYTLDS